MNRAAGVGFLVALVLTVLFASVNLQGALKVHEPSETEGVVRMIPSYDVKNGATMPTLQKVPSDGTLERGAAMPQFQPIPQPAQTQRPQTTTPEAQQVPATTTETK
jgi:hypothetical protein